MPRHSQHPGLYIQSTSSKGRGVYTSEDISAGDVIEICPVILLDKDDTSAIHETHLHDYYFLWDEKTGESAIALGYGSLYNHHETPNADYLLIHASQEIRFTALRDIAAGSEILINYQMDKMDAYPLWFKPNA